MSKEAMNDNRAEQVFKDFDKWLDLVKSGEAEITSISVMRKPKPWVGLTDEDLPALAGDNGKVMELQQVRRFAKVIEAKLKEKNT